MYAYTCMYACMYACMYVCIYVCMSKLVRLGMYEYTHVCMYIKYLNREMWRGKDGKPNP